MKKAVLLFVCVLISCAGFADISLEGREKLEALRAKFSTVRAEESTEAETLAEPREAAKEPPMVQPEIKTDVGPENIFKIINTNDRKTKENLEKHIKLFPKSVGLKLSNGSTPLHEAAQWCNAEIVKLLLSNGAEINAKNDGGFTPIDFASSANAKILKDAGAKPSVTETSGVTTAAHGSTGSSRPRLTNGNYTLHRGKRGGVYHYSASGKKVYHKRR